MSSELEQAREILLESTTGNGRVTREEALAIVEREAAAGARCTCLCHHLPADEHLKRQDTVDLLARIRELGAETAKWESLHDADTATLQAEQRRDSMGPTETLDETARRLVAELDRARLDALTLTEDLRTARAEVAARSQAYAEDTGALRAEVERLNTELARAILELAANDEGSCY